MPIFCIWSGGDGTQTDTTQTASTLDWSKADTTIASLVGTYATALTTSGNIIYIAHDHVDQETHAGTRTFVGPTIGVPVIVISADRGQSTPTYLASSTNQIDTAKDGAHQIGWDGSFALYGLCMAAGARIQATGNDNNEYGHVEGCRFKLAANGDLYIGSSNSRVIVKNCIVDLTADGTTNRASAVIFTGAGWFDISGLSFVNPGYRTTAVFGPGIGQVLRVSSCDFSGFPEATELTTAAGSIEFVNCKMRTNQAVWNESVANISGYITAINCGTADAPESLKVYSYGSTIISDTSVYRTSSGASVEGIAHSWKVVTNTADTIITEHAPIYSPWIYGVLSSAGSKTFTIHMANNAADLTDAEAWMEVEFMGEANSSLYTFKSDQRNGGTASAGYLGPTTTPVAQTDDTTSTWTGATLTYLQSLAVTGTVGEEGLYRARVVFGKSSVTAYVDPKVIVT